MIHPPRSVLFLRGVLIFIILIALYSLYLLHKLLIRFIQMGGSPG